MAITGRARLPHILLSKGRVEALTDGIFAIVMTLLVLELKVPDLPHTAGRDEILAKISAEGESSLTEKEREILKEASRRYKKR